MSKAGSWVLRIAYVVAVAVAVAACGDDPAPGPAAAELALTGGTSADVDLAVVAPGERRDVSMELTNRGGGPTGVIAATFDGDPAFTIVDGDTACAGQVLAPGARCTVTLRFAPLRTGEHTAALRIAAAPGGQQALQLRGRGEHRAPPRYGKLSFQVTDTDVTRALPALHLATLRVFASADVEPVTYDHSAGPHDSLRPGGEYDLALSFLGRLPAGDLTFHANAQQDAFDVEVSYVIDGGEPYIPVCGMTATGRSTCVFPFAEALTSPSYAHLGPLFADEHAPSCDPNWFHNAQFEQAVTLTLPVPVERLSFVTSVGAPLVSVYRADGDPLGSLDMPELACAAPAAVSLTHLLPARYLLVFDGQGSSQSPGTPSEQPLASDFAFTLRGDVAAGVTCSDPSFASGLLRCPIACVDGVCR